MCLGRRGRRLSCEMTVAIAEMFLGSRSADSIEGRFGMDDVLFAQISMSATLGICHRHGEDRKGIVPHLL